METVTFICSICGDASHQICVYCTKDACSNHLCRRCHRCSDCCECDMPVTSEPDPPQVVIAAPEPQADAPTIEDLELTPSLS